MKDCPVCAIPMDEVPKSGVLIDICPRCKGIWLDRGELNRLLDSLKEYRKDYDDYYEKRANRPEYEQHHQDKYYQDKHHYDKHHYDKHHYKHGHKKKGLFKMLEDIFD